MKHKFLEKIDLKKLFWIFIIGSVIGAFYEEILFIIRHFIKYGTFMWEPRRGVFWGPISPVYGIGAVVMSIILVNVKDKWYMTFLKSAVLGGLVEYVCSFMQELVIGSTSWNYSNKFLNINGRTTVPYMLFWGLLGILFLKFIYPLLSKLIDNISANTGARVTKFVIVVISIDIIVSWSALMRQSLRNYGIGPLTKVDQVYDRYFGEDYIAKKFPNMVWK